MHVVRKSLWAVSALALVGVPTAAWADRASKLTYINGAMGRDAEYQLQEAGFKHISTNKNSMGYVYSYWWDSKEADCVQVEVYNGRVETIQNATHGDCGHSDGGGDAAAAVGIVAGAAILGALLSHKSSHHEDNNHHSDADAERLYERGYKDGLYNASYHNAGRNDEYAAGYQAGVDERNANLSHHTGRGGYHPAVSFNDLQGARAAGGMSELESRGFRQVDNFTSGNSRYSIQWNPATRQCVQVTIADGHFYDIRDIGQNPNCR